MQETIDKAIDFEKSVKKDDYIKGGDGNPLNFIVPSYSYNGAGKHQYVLPEELPPYNRYAHFSWRDVTLFSALKAESFWQSAVNIATTKISSSEFAIESVVPLRRKRLQEVLKLSSAGVFIGFVKFITAHLQGYLATGKGIVEIERETAGYGSRIRALHHLNPLRCLITDDPQTPVIYLTRSGELKELKYWQVMLFADGLDATEGEYSLVNSATERAYNKIVIMQAIERYLYEKITGKRTTALHFISGILDRNIRQAIESADNEMARKGLMIYKGATIVPMLGDIPLSLVTVPLAEIPDGFTAQEERDNAILAYADAIGMDVGEIDPRIAQATGLGSGAQSRVLHEKQKGKGLVNWKIQWANNINMWVADASTTFVWSEDDLDDEKKKVDIEKTRTDTNKTRIDAGIITAEQAKNLLVDDGDIPRTFLDTDKTPGGSLESDEKPIELSKPVKQEINKPTTPKVDGETEKHLQGKHNQASHAYRYGKNLTLERARALRGAGNWGDYKKRSRQRSGTPDKSAERKEKKAKRQTKALGTDPTKQYDLEYEVVDLNDLIPSNTSTGAINPSYSQELQPRDRSRQASQNQIDNVAKNLQPEAMLWDFHQIDKGTPIVGDSDNMVESGNGRTLALMRAKERYPEQWDKYQEGLKKQASEYGFDAGDLDGIENPVLVRRRKNKLDRAEFAREANEAAVLQMSPLERAKVDARKLKDSSVFGLEVRENESIDQALRAKRNSGFVRDFMGTLPENERAQLMRANGTLNQMGLWRMKAAVFTKVFPGEAGERIADTFLEGLDSTTKNFEKSITQVLPKLAKAETLISSGQRPKVSIMNDVSRSLDMLARLRENGVKVPDYLKQGALFQRELTPNQEKLLKKFDEIGRSTVSIRNWFNGYADAVINMKNPAQMGLFGSGTAGMSSGDIFAILQGKGLL